MPIGLDPNESVPVSLKTDAAKAEGVRPEFLFHYLTRRDVREHGRLIAAADADGIDDEQCERLLDDAIRVGLVGWHNVTDRDGTAIPYAADASLDFLTAYEKWELALTYTRDVAHAEGLKKKSGSPSGSGTGGSVNAASADGAPTAATSSTGNG